MLTSAAPLLNLHTNIIRDWLPRLGDKAFLAWLHFHSWTTERINQENSFLLPLSLNKIIKRLKTGKVTFYEKVLRPLLNFGLISLHPASHSKQEMHLVVYSSPFDSAPSEQEDQRSSSPEWDEPCVEQDDQPSFSPLENSKDPHDQPDDDPSLSLIEKAISEDPRLVKKRSDILYAYHKCKTHPRFDAEAFIRKMKTCIQYTHKNFGAYLLTSMLKEWDKPSSPSLPASTRQSNSPYKSDLPPWIVEQEKRQGQQQPKTDSKLTSEQQAIADELLRQLGELSS